MYLNFFIIIMPCHRFYFANIWLLLKITKPVSILTSSEKYLSYKYHSHINCPIQLIVFNKYTYIVEYSSFFSQLRTPIYTNQGFK